MKDSKRPRFNEAQQLMKIHLGELGIEFISEFVFHPTRNWRLDFYLLESGIGIEINGAIYTMGRHTQGAGFQADMEKLNEATMAGIRILQFSTQDVRLGRAKKFLKDMLFCPRGTTPQPGRSKARSPQG